MKTIRKVFLAIAFLTAGTFTPGQDLDIAHATASAPQIPKQEGSGSVASLRNKSGLIATWQGPNGRPFYFDGRGGVEGSSSADVNLPNGSPWTLEAWVKPSIIDGGEHVAGKRDGCSGGDGFYQLAIDHNPPGTGMSVDPAYTPVNTWTHIAIVADGIKGWVAFANGVPVKTVNEFGWKIQRSGTFLIGGSGTCAPFKGAIAEVSLYNRALSAQEVMAAYQEGLHHQPEPSAKVTAAAAPGDPVRVSAEVAEKLLISRPPAYSDFTARQARVQGIVKLEFTVTANGDVKDVKVLSGHPLLQRSAVDSLSQSKYRPYMVNGQPTAMRTTAEIMVRLLP